jgi:hypothetical protein
MVMLGSCVASMADEKDFIVITSSLLSERGDPRI